MNFYDLFTNSIYLYLSDFRNRIEISIPALAGSYSIITGFAMDFGVITLCLGGITGLLGILEKGVKLRREYLALKLDKAKADKIMKNLEDDDPNNDKDILKDNGSNI